MYSIAKNSKLKGLLARCRQNQVDKLAKTAKRLLSKMKATGIKV